MKLKAALTALTLAAAASSASAAIMVSSTLTGDPRLANPDGLIVNVTVDWDGTSDTTAIWTVDLNSPLHASAKLGTFAFNLTGAPSNYTFSGFNPSGWSITSPASNVPGGGGIDFVFEADDPPGSGNNVTNTQALVFTATLGSGFWSTSLFGPVSTSNDATLGGGVFGAHLQSLTVSSTTCPTLRCTSDSGFVLGSPGSTTSVPLPGTVLLMGLGLMALSVVRRHQR